jgi:hypothetical protein
MKLLVHVKLIHYYAILGSSVAQTNCYESYAAEYKLVHARKSQTEEDVRSKIMKCTGHLGM